MRWVDGSTEISQHYCNSDMKRRVWKEKGLKSETVEKSLADYGVTEYGKIEVKNRGDLSKTGPGSLSLETRWILIPTQRHWEVESHFGQEKEKQAGWD